MTAHIHTPAHALPRSARRSRLQRARTVLGVPSTLVIAGFFFTQSLINATIPHLGGYRGEFIWLAGWALLALLAYRRWEKGFERTLSITQLGQNGTGKLRARRGLVVVLGLGSHEVGSSLAKTLAAATNLEYIALLGTPQTQERGVARGVRTLIQASGHQLPAANIRTWEEGNNAESLADFERSCTEAVAWMVREGLTPSEILVDVTDGRRPMGFGAFIGAEAAGVEAQYLAYRWDHIQNRPVTSEPMFKIVRELTGTPSRS